MAMEEKLKQVVEELKKQAEIWNQEYDDTMIEEMREDVIEIFTKNGFEELKPSYEAGEGIIEFLERNGFKCFAEVEGFNVDDIWHDTYLVYYKGNTVVVVREHTVYIGRGENMKFYNLVGAFKLKE